MAGSRIKFKMGYRQVEAIAMLHHRLADAVNPQPGEDHLILLCAHLHHFANELADLLRKEQNSYTWTMNEVESLAFCQAWDLVDATIHASEYEALQLQEIKNTIDKYRKNKQPRDYYEAVKTHAQWQQPHSPQAQPQADGVIANPEHGAGFGMGY